MKPFWQRPPQKSKKKKHKTKPTPKQHQTMAPKQLNKWVPPHLTKSKIPVTEKHLLVEAPVTYTIPPAPTDTNEAPIPQQHLKEKKDSPKSQQARKDFLQAFRSLMGKHRSWDIWSDFVTLTACTISNAVDKSHYDKREKRYLQIIRKYNKQEREVFPKLFAFTVLALGEDPEQDFLGELYTELNLHEEERKQIFTPYNICHLMADITLGGLVQDVEEKGYVEIHDCCCGAGAILIAATNVARGKLEKAELNYQNHILVSGQDLDEIVLMMCYIQLSLLGVAGYFKVGNALTEPMTTSDSLDDYWFTPMYFFPVWHYRRMWHRVEALFKEGDDNEKQSLT